MQESRADVIDRPHWIWKIIVWGGLGLLAIMAFSGDFYAMWNRELYQLPAQSTLAWIFVACVPVHLFEALYAYRLARKLGLDATAASWAWQCFAIGFPATWLLIKRKRAAEASGATS